MHILNISVYLMPVLENNFFHGMIKQEKRAWSCFVFIYGLVCQQDYCMDSEWGPLWMLLYFGGGGEMKIHNNIFKSEWVKNMPGRKLLMIIRQVQLLRLVCLTRR